MATTIDGTFWPPPSPRFDFTLKFEEIIFSLVPSSCFVVVASCLCYQLCLTPIRTGKTVLFWAKLVAVSLHLMSRVASIAIWIKSARLYTNTTVPAAAIDLIAAMCMGCLVYMEHRHSIRSSALFTLYLFTTILTDSARSRSLFLRELNFLGGFAVTAAALKCILLALQEVPKAAIIVDNTPHPDVGVETTSGPLSRLLMLFLRPLFRIGFRGQLLMRHLSHLDPEFASKLLYKQLSACWSPRAGDTSVQSHALVKACLKTWRTPLFVLVIMRLAVTGFNFAQPFIIFRVIEFVGRSNNGANNRMERGGLVGASSMVFLGIAFSQAVFAHEMNRFVTQLRGGLIALLFHKEHKLTEKEAKKATASTLMSADLDGIATGVPQCLDIPIGVLELALGVYLLSNYIGVSSLVAIGPLTLTTVVMFFMGKKMSTRFTNWNKSIEMRIAQTTKILPQLTPIKMLGLGPTTAAFLQRLRLEEIEVSKHFRRLEALAVFPLLFGDQVTPVIVIASAFFGSALEHNMTAGKVFPILAVISLIVRPLLALLRSFSTVSSALACFSRIQDFLVLPEKRDCRRTPESAFAVETCPPGLTPGSIIRFNHADITHYGGTSAFLRGVNFELARGSITGVLGPVGAGKSTILGALLGEVELLGGSIEVETTDIAYCGQHVWLRNTTIRENIVGYLEYNETRFKKVLRACVLEEDVEWLPGGVEYVVGIKGSNLSGGQRQRVALARTAYAESTIVLIDDAFSSLDAVTAVCILYQLCGSNGIFRQAGCTVLVATYIPQCLELANQLLFLNGLGTAVLNSQFTVAEYTPLLVTALAPMNKNVPASLENKEQDTIRRSLDASIPPVKSSDATLRQRGNLSLYLLFIDPIGRCKTVLFACLASFASALEVIPDIYIRIWIQSDSESSFFFIGYIAVAIGACFCALLENWLLHTQLSPRSSASLHQRLVQAMIGSTLAFLSTVKSGSLLNLYSQDMTLISRSLPASFLRTIYAGSNAVMNTGIILSGASYLSVVLPVLLIILFFIQRYYLRTSRQIRYLDLEMKAPLYTFFEETASGLTHIRAFRWQQGNIDFGLFLLDESQKPFYVMSAIQVWLRLVLGLVTALLGTLLVALSVFVEGSSSQPAIGLSFISLIYLSHGLEAMINAWATLETSAGALARISHFERDTPQESSQTESHPELPRNWPANGRVTLRNVYAHYSRAADVNPALCNVSISIDPRQKVGIAGRSGSGKSSLLLTLLGFIEYDGKIEVDNIDLSTVSRDDLRSRLVTITQDQVRFDATIRINLLPFTMNDVALPSLIEKAEEKDLELQHLLKSLHIWAPLADKGGLNSLLEDVGYSKGQMQLLCIARAILRRRETGCRLILVDEATSSIDASTERIVHQVMKDYFTDCTVLTIAHRQSSLEDVDKVIRLHRGALVSGNSRYYSDSEASDD